MYRAESLDSEGFIHFSGWSQLRGTVSRYYDGVPGLVVLVVDPWGSTSESTTLSAVVEVMPLGEALERAAA